MYKMIIADDEQQILDGINMCINWTEMDVSIVGTATNGLHALALIKDLEPDILITDIKMPGLCGLDLIKKVKMFSEDIEIIIISAHQDFDFAKRAMDLGVVTYITKPIKKDMISKEVKKVVQKIISRQKQSKKITHLNDMWGQSIPLINEYYLNQLIMGRQEIYSKVKALPFMYEFIEQSGWFSVIVLQRYDTESIFNNSLVTTKIDETFSKFYLHVMFKSYNNEYVIMYFHKVKEYIHEYTEEQVKVLISELNKEKIYMQAGIGGVYKKFDNMYLSYIEAVKALSYRDNSGRKKIFNSRTLETHKDFALYSRELEPLFNEFEMNLIKGKYLYIKEVLDQINEVLSHRDYVYWDTVQQTYCQLASIIISSLNTLKIPLNNVISTQDNLYHIILNTKTLDSLEVWLLDILKKICGLYHHHYEKTENASINKAIDYIYDNYNKDLSLNDVAGYVKLNPSYFSRLFKSYVGISFVEYVKNVKVSVAKRLLRSTNDKVYTVCNKVGYTSVQYFTNLFKDKVGVTPKQYRNQV